LLEGVTKGAFSEEIAEQKFNTWNAEKNSKLESIKIQVVNNKEADKKQRLEAETKVKEAKAQAIAKRLAAEKIAEQPVTDSTSAEPASE